MPALPRPALPGHVAVESYLEEQDMPYTVFQPLYIYGPHTAKDCEQWFMDRVLRWVVGLGEALGQGLGMCVCSRGCCGRPRSR